MASVDVVIPCYGYGRFLKESVESVLAQAQLGLDVRVLIIDDASPDNTAEVGSDLTRRSNNVVFWRHPTNKGHIYTYNEGIDWASGDYFLLLSADDYLLPGALQRAVGLMEENPQVGFSFGKVIQLEADGTAIEIDPLGRERGQGNRVVTGLDFIKLSGGACIVAAPTAVVRTALQKLVGGYRPELPHSADMEMWLRLATGASVGFVDSFQAVYRRHSENMSLSYNAGYMLPDLKQRKLTFDYFFQTRAGVLPDASRLRGELYGQLAQHAVGWASTAFNNGQVEISDNISRFALDVHPDVKSSLSWLKLTCKRTVGFRVWRTLHAARLRVGGSRSRRVGHARPPL